MSKEILPIAVDAMGGDNAPGQVVAGALETGLPVILVGREDVLTPLVKEAGAPSTVKIVHAEGLVGGDDLPFAVVRSKKDSSMMTAIRLVKEGKAAGVMSAGNTGAFMAGATLMLGRLPGVTRPAVAITIPGTVGNVLLLDAGASTDCTSEDLLNFAIMGETFVKLIRGIEKPRIGLLSIGEEEIKGTKQAREVHQGLKDSWLNFIGNVEGSDIGSTSADVIVTDGFTGNVALKAAEGTVTLIMEVVKQELSAARAHEKLAAWILKPLLKRIKTRLDWQEYSGGSLLGVKGNVVITHGKSGKKAIMRAIKLASDLAQTDLLQKLETGLRAHHGLERQTSKT